MRILILLSIVILIFKSTNAQPGQWSDVCISSNGQNICYLWTGAPFPFSDIGSFLNNPFCSSPCTIYISPFLMTCGVLSGNGCYFLEVSNVTQPFAYINCNLTIPCADATPLTFLPTIQSTYSTTMTAFLQTTSPGGLISNGDILNAFSLPNPPRPILIRWDGPLAFNTPKLTIDSMWSGDVGTQNPISVQIQSFSPRFSANPNVNPSCTLINVNSIGVSFKNLAFNVDPYCGLYPTPGTIVYNGAVGTVTLANITSSNTVFPIIYMRPYYAGGSSVNVVGVVFDSSLNIPTNSYSSTTPLTINNQLTSAYSISLFELDGILNCDLVSSCLFFGTAVSTLNNPLSAILNTSFQTQIDPALFGCIDSTFSNSDCDDKNTTDLVLVIITSTMFATILLYALLRIRRAHQSTLANAKKSMAVNEARSEILADLEDSA